MYARQRGVKWRSVEWDIPNNYNAIMERVVVKEASMDWQDYIHSDPQILVGKPVVKGTRLSVEFLLGLFGAGWTEQQVLESYPTLTPIGLRAVFAFAAECMSAEALYVLPSKTS